MHGRDQLDTLWPEAFNAQQRSELPAEEFHVVDPGDDLGWPYTYYDQLRGERMVSPEYGGDGKTPAKTRGIQGSVDRLPGSLGAERPDLLHGHAVSGEVPRRRVHRVSRLVEPRERKTATASCSCR